MKLLKRLETLFLIQTSLENVFGPTVYSKMFNNKRDTSLSDY